MKLKFTIVLLFFSLLVPSHILAQKLRVVTSIPDLADIAREIGQEHVDVVSLSTGVENMHFVPQKPGFLITLRNVDVLIVIGMQAEHSWLPPLIRASYNRKIAVGMPGFIDASKYIIPIQVPNVIDMAQGHVHPQGNPHYNLDPKAGPKMARAIAEGFIANDPGNTTDYEANLSAYTDKLKEKWREWKDKGKKLQGLTFISYHQTFGYISNHFKMRKVGTIQVAPGVEPTPGHLKKLLEKAQQSRCDVVLRETTYSERIPRRIAQQLNVPLVNVPLMVGGVPEVKTWTDLIDFIIDRLLEVKK